MAQTEEETSRRWRLIVRSSLAAAACILVLSFWRFTPPQMGNDEEVFRTVDALFTAVTSRSPKLLDECDERLMRFREEGKMPEASANYVNGVIRQARSGKWEPAAKRLYEFMYGQRRQ